MEAARDLISGNMLKTCLTWRPQGNSISPLLPLVPIRAPQRCPIVNVGVCLKNYLSLNLSLYVMPNICEPLVGQSIAACVKKHPHLVELELADFS